MTKQIIRINIEGNPYLAERDSEVEGIMDGGTFNKVIRRFIIYDADKPSTAIGCIVFYTTLLSSYSWETDEETEYGNKENYNIPITSNPFVPVQPSSGGSIK